MGQEHHKKGPLIGAFLAGALTTVAVGGYLLFGPGGRRRRRKVERWVLLAQTELIQKMEDLGDVTREQYNNLVDRVTARYGALRQIGGERLREVQQDLKSRYEEMKASAKRAREESEEEMPEDEEEQEPTSRRRSKQEQ